MRLYRRFLRVLRKHQTLLKGNLSETLKSVVFLLPRVERIETPILFYPDKPLPGYLISQSLALIGYRKTDDPEADVGLVFCWIDDTYPESDNRLQEMARRRLVINVNVRDISKRRIDQLMDEVFGYSALVDPTNYSGTMVKKSDRNAEDNESVHEGPIPATDVDPSAVYQKLLGIRDGDRILEHRLTYFMGGFVAVVERRRPVSDPFGLGNELRSVVPASEAMNGEEEAKVRKLLGLMDVDFCDLDLMREPETGRLHVLDINPTSWGWENPGWMEEARAGLIPLAVAVEKMVIEQRARPTPNGSGPLQP